MAAMDNAPAAAPAPLIPVAELAAVLGRSGSEPPVLLDVRWQLGGPAGEDEYAKGHLPGAYFVDLERELSSPPAVPPGPGGRHPLPDPGALAAVLRRTGVRADRPVVVYDAGPATAAARAWWLLRWAGHPDVRVLDGGLRAWEAAGLPVTIQPPAAPEPPGDFVPKPGGMPVVDAAGAARIAAAEGGLLLDARAGERYRGETEPIDSRAGHIPGAVSAPTTENVGQDAAFRPRPELAGRFRELGATEAAEVAVYCGSGVTAAHEILALELAGVRAALYPGSWSEWSSDPARPVATG